MKSHLSKTAPAALFVLFTTVAATTANAQIVIFDSTQGGNFYGDADGEIGMFETQQGGDIYNGDNGAGSPRRRADAQGDFFFANILFDGAGGFGGIDQVNGNGNPGHLTNDGSTNTATFFANNGAVVGMPDGSSSESDDTLPSGVFLREFSQGDRIDFVADITTNANPGGDDPTAPGPADSTFEIGFRFDGSEVVQTAPAVSFPTAAGTTTVMGSFFVTGDATSFNPVSILTNPGTGSDQIGVDNIVLTLFENVAVVGDVVRDGILNEADFNAIRDNFFNTGAIGITGEAIGSEDGVVDLDDFITFRTAFLNSGGTPQQFAAFGAVPEPAAAMTLVCGLVLSCCRRSRRA